MDLVGQLVGARPAGDRQRHLDAAPSPPRRTLRTKPRSPIASPSSGSMMAPSAPSSCEWSPASRGRVWGPGDPCAATWVHVSPAGRADPSVTCTTVRTVSITAEAGTPSGADGHDATDAAVAAVAAAFGDPTRRDILFMSTGSAPGARHRGRRHLLAAPQRGPAPLGCLVDGGYLRVETGRHAAGAGRPSRSHLCVEEERLARADAASGRPAAHAAAGRGHATAKEAEEMAANVGEEYGRSLASAHGRSQRGPAHGSAPPCTSVAETLTAHGFAAHAEDRGETTAVVAEQCPFGDASNTTARALRRRPRHGEGLAVRALRHCVRAGAAGDPVLPGPGPDDAWPPLRATVSHRLSRPRQHDAATTPKQGAALRR